MSAVLHAAAWSFVLLGAAARPAHRRWWWAASVACLLTGLFALGGFFASKWLGRLVMPPALVGIGLGALLTRHLLRRGPRREGIVLGILFGVHVIASNVWFGASLVRWLEAPFTSPVLLEAPLDATLVLGGGVSTREDGGPQLSPSGDRVMTALRLHGTGRTKLLVFSGTAAATEGRAAESLGDRTIPLLEEAGLPAAAVVALPGPRNTREELAAFADLVRERGWRRVGVVTSAWHLRRALRHAMRQRLEVVAVPADYRGGHPPLNALELLPSAEGVYLTRLAAWELLGALVGR